MKVQLESTTKIVFLEVDGLCVPARVWEGHTEAGIPCHAFITRIAVANGLDSTEFERELQQCRAPSAAVDAIPVRMIL